jgi:hypothetical protein
MQPLPPPKTTTQTPRMDKTNGIFHEEQFPDLMNSIHAPPKQTNNQKQKENEKDKAKLKAPSKPGTMWADIVKSKGNDLIWGRTAIDGKTEFSLDGTRAKDGKISHKVATTSATQNNPLLPVKESKDPRDRQIIMQRNLEALKPEHSMIKSLIHQINQHLSEKGIHEHIHVDNARPTPNDNWSIFSKQKVNAKMLTHEKIKPLILEATKKIDKEIIDTQEVLSWPRMKIHQIALDEHMAFRHDFNKTQEEIHQSSRVALGIIQSRIEAEYDVTVQHIRWIKSIHHYIEEAQNRTETKKKTHNDRGTNPRRQKGKGMAIKEDNPNHRQRTQSGTLRRSTPSNHVQSCCKHGHGAHNCRSPNNPRCGICAGTHHTNDHKCKVRSCPSAKRKRCYDHNILQCINCNGDHTVWNKTLCKVRQHVLTKLQKSLHTPEPRSFPENPSPSDDETLAIDSGELDAIMKTPTMEEHCDEEDHTEPNMQQSTPNAEEEMYATTQ